MKLDPKEPFVPYLLGRWYEQVPVIMQVVMCCNCVSIGHYSI